MNHFSVEFYHPGPYTSFPDEDETTKSALRYDALIERTLKEAGFDLRHQYSWPDGSCYKYVRSDKDGINLVQDMNRALDGTGCKAHSVQSLEADHPTDLHGEGSPRTVGELFLKAPPA